MNHNSIPEESRLRFLRAAAEGNLSILEEMIEENPHITSSTSTSNKSSALHYAAYHGKLDAVKLLLKFMSPCILNSDKQFPIDFVAKKNPIPTKDDLEIAHTLQYYWDRESALVSWMIVDLKLMENGEIKILEFGMGKNSGNKGMYIDPLILDRTKRLGKVYPEHKIPENDEERDAVMIPEDSASIDFNHRDISSYKGISFVERKNMPKNVMVIDGPINLHFFFDVKSSMKLLFDRIKMNEYIPETKFIGKKYNKNLARIIEKDMEADSYVLKICSLSKGRGVVVVEKKYLDFALKHYLTQEPLDFDMTNEEIISALNLGKVDAKLLDITMKQIKLIKQMEFFGPEGLESVIIESMGKLLKDNDLLCEKLRLYMYLNVEARYWLGVKTPMCIVQKYYRSKLVEGFDSTIRTVFMMKKDNLKYSFEPLASYHKLPPSRVSLLEPYNRDSRVSSFVGDRVSVLDVSNEDKNHIYGILSKIVPIAFEEALSTNVNDFVDSVIADPEKKNLGGYLLLTQIENARHKYLFSLSHYFADKFAENFPNGYEENVGSYLDAYLERAEIFKLEEKYEEALKLFKKCKSMAIKKGHILPCIEDGIEECLKYITTP